MDEDVELPLAKRPRREQTSRDPKQPTSSRLFAPFRTLGLVSSTTVPFTSVPLGKTTFQITTSIGNSLQTYDLRRGLSLVFLSRPECPATITATCAYRDRVFVAWGGSRPDESRGVWIFKRGQLVQELSLDDAQAQEIRHLLVFGSWIVGCGSQSIEIWKTESYEHYTSIQSSIAANTGSRGSFTGQVCTLPTLLNKVFVGTKHGSIEVYNVSTGRLVHTILSSSARSGPVTALAPVPALCLLAVAYSHGSLSVVDVEADEVVLELRQANNKRPITSITFRTDGMGAGEDGQKKGIMATSGTETGDITLWDLNRGGRVVGVVRGAHETSNLGHGTGVNRIEFLPGQPVLVSSGLDNALRSWVFDQTPISPTPRLLHSRSGHSASITRLKFLPAASDGSDAAGKWLLSASQDRSLWGFSLRKDAQSTELSQGAVKHKARKSGLLTDGVSAVEAFKAPPIIDMACSLNRDGGMGSVTGSVWSNTNNVRAEESSTTGWESVVTAHADDKFARTWSWGRKKAGRWAFETGDHKAVTSVAMTACGTFAIIGSAGGSLDMFNLQSGAHRQRYPPRLTPSQAKQLKLKQADPDQVVTVLRGHRDAITGVVVDNLNQTMVSISLDGIVIFWDFSSGKILERKGLDSATPTALRYNPVSGLIALSCDDLCIRILDIATRKVVRELWGCIGQIYDLCFSQDGRWIIAASTDSVVRVFDLATGHLIDAFKTAATCTNMVFSSTGEFLATTHAGSPGIFVWTNKALFTHVATRQIDDVKGIIDLSKSPAAFNAASQLAIDDTGPGDVDEEPLTDGLSPTSQLEQLDKSLLTLSLQPRSRWQTLLNLDSIRARNKPILPPEKPKAAPFFLGTSASLTNGSSGGSNGLDSKAAVDEAQLCRVSRLTLSSTSKATTSQFSTLLSSFSSNASPSALSALTSYLTALPPSTTDLEIRSLTLPEMPIFIAFLTSLLRARKSFELVNTWMAVFLRCHGEFVAEVEELRREVVKWREVMVQEEARLGELVGYSRGVVEFVRSAR